MVTRYWRLESLGFRLIMVLGSWYNHSTQRDSNRPQTHIGKYLGSCTQALRLGSEVQGLGSIGLSRPLQVDVKASGLGFT